MTGTRPTIGRWVWVGLLTGICLEFALGVACVVWVPAGRPDEWIPVQGRAVYVAHAVIGAILGIGALVSFLAAAREERTVFLGSGVGLAGLLLAAGGGMLAVYHPWRLTGMALMFGGSFVALFGFLIALHDPTSNEGVEEQGGGVGGSSEYGC
jgi:hypothetical protein